MRIRKGRCAAAAMLILLPIGLILLPMERQSPAGDAAGPDGAAAAAESDSDEARSTYLANVVADSIADSAETRDASRSIESQVESDQQRDAVPLPQAPSHDGVKKTSAPLPLPETPASTPPLQAHGEQLARRADADGRPVPDMFANWKPGRPRASPCPPHNFPASTKMNTLPRCSFSRKTEKPEHKHLI